MIYWLQEATEAGAQGAASSWESVLLTNGVVGALVGLVGVLIGQYLQQRRHSQTLEQTAELETQRANKAAELEAQRAHEAALQKYFEQMRETLADPKRPLRRSTMGDALSTIARAQTLAVLEGLDPERKGILLQFLYESNLIAVDKPIVSLIGAHLRNVNLSYANLIRGDLSGADLEKARMYKANLVGANLYRANLAGAYLFMANLFRANLAGSNQFMTNLFGANLAEAYLAGAKLSGTDLSNASLERANLAGAYLGGAKLGGAKLGGADLNEANLSEASLSRADLSGAINLTQDQINEADGDEHTKLPAHLHRPPHWSKGESEESSERSPAP